MVTSSHVLQPLAYLYTEGLVDSLKVASLACLDCSFGIKKQVIVPKVHACSHCCSLDAIAEVVITCSSDQHVFHDLIWSIMRQHPEDICKAKQCTGMQPACSTSQKVTNGRCHYLEGAAKTEYAA